MEEINLHFIGDIHAIGSAKNLLATVLDSHILHGNALGIDPATISWRRCLDMDDGALRSSRPASAAPRTEPPSLVLPTAFVFALVPLPAVDAAVWH
jgi:formyltetrahydrofolate synthetase